MNMLTTVLDGCGCGSLGDAVRNGRPIGGRVLREQCLLGVQDRWLVYRTSYEAPTLTGRSSADLSSGTHKVTATATRRSVNCTRSSALRMRRARIAREASACRFHTSQVDRRCWTPWTTC
jgi:hypothetical protein